jgi:hypothetical protein
MHALVLCSLLAATIVPPTTTHKGKSIKADNAIEAAWELEKLPGERLGTTASPTDNWPAWSDDGKFPLDAKLRWVRLSITVTKPKVERFELHLIECNGVINAKIHFLMLRVLRQPDYARSGLYLLKGSPQALDWFAKHYEIERYATDAKPPENEKKK